MSIKHFAILLVFIEYFVLSYSSIDYCDPELCGKPWDYGLKHIACNPFSEFGASCDSSLEVNEIKPDTRFSIVRMHNKLRHNVASGNFDGYRGQKLPKAIKMAHMIWDDELATLALLSALQCKDAAKFCVNTHNYRASGQMIIISRNSTSNPSLQYLRSLKRIGMYGRLMDPAYIRKYPKDSIAKTNGFDHFAIMIIDHNNRIGCASVTTEQESYFVCHYASRNMPNLKIYETGKTTASACTKTHREFSNLCGSTTEIDPNVNFKEALKQKHSEERITPKDEALPTIPTTSKTLTPSEIKAKEDQLVTTTPRARPVKPPTGDDYSDEDEDDIGHGYGTPQEYHNGTLWVYLEKKKSKLHSCDVKLCQVTWPFEPLIQTTCNFSLSFGGNCPKTTKAHIFSDEEKDTVVDIINTYRNSMAGGEVVGRNEERFPKATKMAYTKWDDELADLALLDGKDCVANKTFRACGNSERYRKTGKIYYLNTVSSAEKPWPRMNLRQAFERIFELRVNVETDIMNLVLLIPFEVIQESNFLEMFTDQSTRIGCSVVMWENVSGPRYEFLICYTSSGIIPNFEIYNDGDVSASNCMRKHLKFPNLCAEDEQIDPNERFKQMKDIFDDEFYEPESLPKIVERITNRRNYCDPSFCEIGEKHVACKTTETFSPSCGSYKMITKFEDFFKFEIVSTHNNLRNLTAGGYFGEGYPAQIPKALRMAYMQWDDELSDLALLDVKECEDHKKSCHNTPSYKASGQNVFRMSFEHYITQDYCIFLALMSWNPDTYTTWHEFVQKFSNDTPTGRELENFALQVIDRNNRVGCAMSIYYGNDNTTQCYVICNYATKLYNSLPVYKTGNVVASECIKTHPEFSNLCAEDEPINPNDLSDITPDLKPLVNKNKTLNVYLEDIVKPNNSTEISDILTPIVNRTQYCDPNLCRKGTHIGCKNTATAGDNCGKVIKLIIMTPERIDIILKTHNELRNLTAGGDAPGSQDQKLPKAVRMGRMQWDQELADLALLNAKTCIFAHDPCHNTEKYKMSGQNIAQFMASRAMDPNIYLKKSVNNWFSESSHTTADHITSYSRSTSPNKPIGHFTQVVNDKSTRVGCAAIIFNVKRDGRILEALLHVCNYARTNILDKPIYKSGNESASQCKTKDNVYINLCHESEDIDPNEVLASPQTDTSRGDLDDFDESYDNDFGMTAPPGFLFEPISPKTDDTSDTAPSMPNSDDYLILFEHDWNKPYPEDEITMPPFSMPTLPTYTTQNINDLLPHSVTEESVTTESFTTEPNVTTEAIQTTLQSVAIPTQADIPTTPHSVTEEPITTVAIPTEADIPTTPQSVTKEPITTVAIPKEADIPTTPDSITEKSTDAPVTTTTTESVIHVPGIGVTEVEEQTTPKTPKQVDDKSGGHTRPRPSKPRRPLPNKDDYFIIRSSNPVYDNDDDDGILIMS